MEDSSKYSKNAMESASAINKPMKNSQDAKLTKTPQTCTTQKLHPVIMRHIWKTCYPWRFADAALRAKQARQAGKMPMHLPAAAQGTPTS
jgi:hypothetical protein